VKSFKPGNKRGRRRPLDPRLDSMELQNSPAEGFWEDRGADLAYHCQHTPTYLRDRDNLRRFYVDQQTLKSDDIGRFYWRRGHAPPKTPEVALCPVEFIVLQLQMMKAYIPCLFNTNAAYGIVNSIQSINSKCLVFTSVKPAYSTEYYY